jgi:hydrogenase expression/formation protein HypD
MNIKTSVENISSISEALNRQLVFMEVCGTHTVSAFRTGLRSRLAKKVGGFCGPGCPVCV